LSVGTETPEAVLEEVVCTPVVATLISEVARVVVILVSLLDVVEDFIMLLVVVSAALVVEVGGRFAVVVAGVPVVVEEVSVFEAIAVVVALNALDVALR
jgi:hypothetical protein